MDLSESLAEIEALPEEVRQNFVERRPISYQLPVATAMSPTSSSPSPKAEASMCHVVTSFITPLARLTGSPLSVPEAGSKGCAINWSPRANRRNPPA